MTKIDVVESKKTRRKLNEIGIERKAVREEFDGPLTPETKAVIPAGPDSVTSKKKAVDVPFDIEVMFLGKMCSKALDFQTMMQNTLAGMQRAYGEVSPEVEAKLSEYKDMYVNDFEASKARATKIIGRHPLAISLCQIKGFTPYALGMIMAYIKDIHRFKTPSALCTYAGTVPKYGIHISKKNILEIRRRQHAERDQQAAEPEADELATTSLRQMEESLRADGVDEEQIEAEVEARELHEFGFNTRLQQRLYILQESFLRANGWFKHQYDTIRPRLQHRAITAGECFKAEAEDVKASKGVMKLGEYYMVGRKNQSLIMWSHRNACWRLTRIFLHILYHEWCLLEGIAPRVPYPVEYLGHQQIFTLQEIVEYERKK